MENNISNLLKCFTKANEDTETVFHKYKDFSFVLDDVFSGEGPVGEYGYLVLWKKSVLEKRNDDYMVECFLDDIFLIGTDGGDYAFGMNKQKQFVVVPFLGMCNENVKVLGNTINELIIKVSNCDY